jgi:arylformamidase
MSGIKSQLVWRDMDQAELDAAYDQNVYAPNRLQILERYSCNSATTRLMLGAPQRFRYGKTEIEGLDIYRSTRTKAPIQIFIHGGAWRSGTAAQYAFPAEAFVRAGAHFVVPDFDWVQDHDGDLRPMVDQVRRAVAWVARHAEKLGGDPDCIYLSGHSSGAHLAGVALTTDWDRDFGLPSNILKGALLCSGMYDLKPVRLSARSSYVTITDEIEGELSALRHMEAIVAPLIIAYGTLETPEFKRQSKEFAEALTARGHSVNLLVAEHCNHFEILETFANPHGLLGRAALAQMGLGYPGTDHLI